MLQLTPYRTPFYSQLLTFVDTFLMQPPQNAERIGGVLFQK